jgi:large subunit ribosomal protein L28e
LKEPTSWFNIFLQPTGTNNSYLVKRNNVQLSRDPLNLTNRHSRKWAGFVNEQVRFWSNLRARKPTVHPLRTILTLDPPQAIGINADSPNTIGLTTKLPSRANKPAKSQQTSSFSASTPGRKLYKSVVNTTAKRGYRADLRAAAVARASAVKLSQQQKKERAASKPRGASAKKAAVQESS